MKKTLKNDANPVTPKIKAAKKILFANVPADGHFNLLTSLAVYLQSIGYDVRWYSSALYEEKINKLQIPYYPFKKGLEVTPENMDAVFPERKNQKSQVSKLRFDMINFFILRSTEYYADIIEIYKSFPFDLMIADVAFSAIPLVKEKMNIPVISIGVFPLAETSRDLAPAGLGLTPSNNFLGRMKQHILRYLADKVLFKEPNRVMKGVLNEYGIDTGNANVFDLLVRKSTMLLQSGTPGFEYKRSDLGSNVRFIGPLLPQASKKSRVPWFNEKLSKYENVIIVTQGTVERDPEKIIVPTLEAFKNSDYLVIATTGGSKTRELKAKYPQENFIIEDFIPFSDIMPYADVFITNGGYGGVMLSIENRVPLVVAGVHEGKNEINARVGYFKLGINLGTEYPKPSQIRKSVGKILSSKTYISNVIDLSDEFNEYSPQNLAALYVAEVLQSTQLDVAYGMTPELEERMAIY